MVRSGACGPPGGSGTRSRHKCRPVDTKNANSSSLPEAHAPATVACGGEGDSPEIAGSAGGQPAGGKGDDAGRTKAGARAHTGVYFGNGAKRLERLLLATSVSRNAKRL